MKRINIKEHIRTVADFPKKGILFYDICSLLMHPEAWQETVRQMTELVRSTKAEKLVAVESRGFLVTAPVSFNLGLPQVLARKPAKLPGEVISHSYQLEYSSDTLEIQKDAIQKGDKVLIADDLLATGGTIKAATELCRKLQADVIGAVAIMELEGLGGREKIGIPCQSLVKFPA